MKKEQQGLILVNTGNGKGKSTAAFGIVFRALGYGQKVAVIQYAKGNWQTGEFLISEKIPELIWIRAQPENGNWTTENSVESNLRLGEFVLDETQKIINNAVVNLLVLDEFCFGLGQGAINLERLLDILKQCRNANINVVITGRNAPDKLIEFADTVTEMTEIKHAYKKGIKARKGIDF